MNKQERGSVSTVLLFVGLFISMMAQLALLWCRVDAGKLQEIILLKQLRLLNTAVFRQINMGKLSETSSVHTGLILQPGNEEVQIQINNTSSSDNLLNYFVVKSQVPKHDGAVQTLAWMRLKTAKVQQDFGGQYALVSLQGIEFEEDFSQKELYIQASKSEEVKLPVLSFLKNKSEATTNAETIVTEGLSRHFHYRDDKSSVLTFPAGNTIYGSSVLFNQYGIKIGNNCVFPERVAFYTSNGNIEIGDGVVFEKALIHAYGSVTIGSGCRINGLIIANKIILKGPSTFSADADVVAPFVSCAFTK